MQGRNDLVWQLISWGLVWNIVKAGGRARPAWIHDLQHLRVILTRKPSCLSGSWCVPGGFLSFQVVHRELTRQCPLLGSSWACPRFLDPPPPPPAPSKDSPFSCPSTWRLLSARGHQVTVEGTLLGGVVFLEWVEQPQSWGRGRYYSEVLDNMARHGKHCLHSRALMQSFLDFKGENVKFGGRNRPGLNKFNSYFQIS